MYICILYMYYTYIYFIIALRTVYLIIVCYQTKKYRWNLDDLPYFALNFSLNGNSS